MKQTITLRHIFLLLLLGGIAPLIAQPAGWSFKMQIEIFNNSNTSRTNYQELITVNTQSLISSGQMKSGGADMRFGDSCSGNITTFKHYIMSGINTTETKVWVLVPSVPANSVTTIWMYYGNSSASNTSDFAGVFPTSLITSGPNQNITGTLTYDWLEVKVNDTLFVTKGAAVDITSRVAIIDGVIMANGAGIDSGKINTSGHGPGRGYISSNGTAGSGGAGYGGSGGQGGYDAGDLQGDSGKVYGTAAGNDIQMGSSGASSDLVLGGAGGGGISLKAAYLELNGSIHANGNPGLGSQARNAGGGSGGGVLLSGATVIFNGKITAKGGDGGVGTSTANDDGGGGGGGRVKIFYGSVSGSGTYDVSGGTGGSNGTAAPGGNGQTGSYAKVKANYKDDSVVLNGILITLSDNDGRICPGTPLTMTASKGFTQYNFYKNTTQVQSGSNNSYTYNNLSDGDSISVLSVLSSCYSAKALVKVKVDTIPVLVIKADTAVCRGDTLKLSASGALVYQWKGGPAKSNWSVVPSGAATYEVSGTDANGCSGKSDKTVNVHDFPVITSSSDTTVCENDSITIKVAGAKWVKWTNGPTANVYKVAPKQTTNYRYLAYDVPICVVSDSVKVEINPIPDVFISGKASACNGQSTTIAANGAIYYKWSTGGTGYLLTVSPTTNTVYTVTGTDAYGCSDTASKLVVVDTIPDVKVTGDMDICKGEGTTLRASGAKTYVWYNNSKADSIVLKPTATAAYSVIGTDGNGCKDTTDATVTIHNPPTVTFDLPTQLDTVCINDSPWPLSGGLPSGGKYAGRGVSNGNFNATVAGQGKFLLRYVVVDSYNCSDSASTSIVVDACAGLDQIAGNKPVLLVYPNPANAEVSITGKPGSYEIFNLQGEKIAEFMVADAARIDVSGWVPGMYIIRDKQRASEFIRLIKF